ncbi:protein GVQW3-like [Cryptotermes secundus]|uniref:protein GVQW3-like n=1 Tax=Cryptotermes secundus TaxID=105785 RepID=UPI000CD7D9B5|nr:protein GVQW3-like [Cryptotermes secundus]
MKQVYGKEALGHSALFKWHQRFGQERYSLEDDEPSGRPKAVTTERKFEEVATLIRANRSQSIDDIAAAAGISHGTHPRIKRYSNVFLRNLRRHKYGSHALHSQPHEKREPKIQDLT